MKIKDLEIPEVKLLLPEQHNDSRGYVAEILQEERLRNLGLPIHFVQENQSLSLKKHTIRGLHFQKPPAAQAKLLRLLRGKAFEVVLDVRPHSPTFGRHVTTILSSDELTQLFIPAGFAHGFCALEDHTVILYKMSHRYEPACESGVLWNDPALAIDWPVPSHGAILSLRDANLPCLKDLSLIEWAA
jgi:dTDP-4-dehydrorhamnose 3,5-epimerase